MNIINLIIGILILFFIILIGCYVIEKGDSFVKVNEGFNKNMPGHDGSGTEQHTWNTSGSSEASTSSTESDSELPSYYLKVKMNDTTWYLQEPTAPPQNEGGGVYYFNTLGVVEYKSQATKFNIHNRGTSNMYITIVDPKNKALPAPYDGSGGSPGSLLQFPTNPNNYSYGTIVIISINDLSTSAGVHPPSLSNGSLSPIYLRTNNSNTPQAYTIDIVPVPADTFIWPGNSPSGYVVSGQSQTISGLTSITQITNVSGNAGGDAISNQHASWNFVNLQNIKNTSEWLGYIYDGDYTKFFNITFTLGDNNTVTTSCLAYYYNEQNSNKTTTSQVAIDIYDNGKGNNIVKDIVASSSSAKGYGLYNLSFVVSPATPSPSPVVSPAPSGSGGFSPSPVTPSPSPAPSGSGGFSPSPVTPSPSPAPSGSGGFSPTPVTPSPSPAPSGSGGSNIDPIINPVISPAPSGSGGFGPIPSNTPKEPIPYCKSPTLPNVNKIYVHYSNTNASL
jgi:hypothetical protein